MLTLMLALGVLGVVIVLHRNKEEELQALKTFLIMFLVAMFLVYCVYLIGTTQFGL